MRPADTINGAFALPFRAIGAAALFLARGRLLNQQTGARFARPREYRSWLDSRHTGLLVDGQSLSLSETESLRTLRARHRGSC